MECGTCLNLKKLYGKFFKIKHDKAAFLEKGGTCDPWYFRIHCKYGHIYPYSSRLLAFYCQSGKIRNRLQRKHTEIELINWSDNGEAIFLFTPDQFDLIARYALPKRKPGPKRLSDRDRKKLIMVGQATRFKSNSTGDNDRKSIHKSMIVTRSISEHGQAREMS